MNRFHAILLFVLAIMISSFLLFYRFYPRQSICPENYTVLMVRTPEELNYHDDCLHPCIRYYINGFAGYKYWMVQSPYYGENSKMENPILYKANTLEGIGVENIGIIVATTPNKGYNSDPFLFREDSLMYIFWRECGTPLCDSLGVTNATVGVSTKDGQSFTSKKVYLTNNSIVCDKELAPVLLKRGDKYLFYATWYQFSPLRKNNGIAIWEGSSLHNPDFILSDTFSFPSIRTVDKCAQLRAFDHIWYIPCSHKFDLWHFDLIEHSGRLIMVASEEKNDVIMLAESCDGKKFHVHYVPLIDNHYMENYIGYRQYYYKPTAFFTNDTLHVLFTANASNEPSRNQLFHTFLIYE